MWIKILYLIIDLINNNLTVSWSLSILYDERISIVAFMYPYIRLVMAIWLWRAMQIRNELIHIIQQTKRKKNITGEASLWSSKESSPLSYDGGGERSRRSGRVITGEAEPDGSSSTHRSDGCICRSGVRLSPFPIVVLIYNPKGLFLYI